MLLKRAYSQAEMRDLISQTAFQDGEIREDSVGMEVWLGQREQHL
jgi:hypothetical protein